MAERKAVDIFEENEAWLEDEDNVYFEKLFQSFLNACSNLPSDAFINKGNGKFKTALFEAVFAAVCEDKLQKKRGTRRLFKF